MRGGLVLAGALLAVACEAADPATPARAPAPAPAAKAPFELTFVSPRLTDTPSWGAAWTDADLDGFPDLLLGRHKSDAWLLTNREGRLVREPIHAFAEAAPGKAYYDRHNCAWGESNGDGRPDAYCVSGAESGTGTGPNQLLLGSGAGLVEATPAVLLEERSRGRSVNWLDYDTDGDLDIFVGNEYLAGSPNALYTRTPGGYVKEPVGVETTMATVSSSWADWDFDGDPDLVALGHGHRPTHVYENLDGTFREVDMPPLTGREWLSVAWADFDHDEDLDALLTGIERAVVATNDDGRFHVEERLPLEAGRQAVWLDLENDGDDDIFVVQGRPGDPPSDDPPFPRARDVPDLLFTNHGGSFSVTKRFRSEDGAGNGDSVAVGDVDRDGRLDLIVTNGYLRDRGPVLFARNTSESQNWAALELVGSDLNPHGYGATLRVRASRPWIVPVTDGVSWHSQSETGHLVIGLGAEKQLPIEVVWGDGSTDCGVLRHGVTLKVRAGGSPC